MSLRYYAENTKYIVQFSFSSCQRSHVYGTCIVTDNERVVSSGVASVLTYQMWCQYPDRSYRKRN